MAALVPVAALMFAATGACRSASASSTPGAASSAAAMYFAQERDGGRLPEGVGQADERGVSGNDIRKLDVNAEQKKDKVKARYCIEYHYQLPPAPAKTRVYTAELVGDAWRVTPVSPDGGCDGVA